MNEWISVKNKLPEPNTPVLIFAPPNDIQITEMTNHSSFDYSIITEPRWVEPYQYFSYDGHKITHWMPLPEYPASWVPSDVPNEKWICSKCGAACWYYDYNGDVSRSRYCPTCGAKMIDFD